MYLRCRCATCRLPKKSLSWEQPSLSRCGDISRFLNSFTCSCQQKKEKKKGKGVFWHRSTLATFFFRKGLIIANYIPIELPIFTVKLHQNPCSVPQVNFAGVLWKVMEPILHACICSGHLQRNKKDRQQDVVVKKKEHIGKHMHKP